MTRDDMQVVADRAKQFNQQVKKLVEIYQESNPDISDDEAISMARQELLPQ